MPLHIRVVRYAAASLAHLSQQERKAQRRCRCPPRFPGGSTTSARGVVFDHNDEALLLCSNGAAGFRQGPLPTKRPAIPYVFNSPGNWRFLQHIIILSSNSLFALHGPCTPYHLTGTEQYMLLITLDWSPFRTGAFGSHVSAIFANRRSKLLVERARSPHQRCFTTFPLLVKPIGSTNKYPPDN